MKKKKKKEENKKQTICSQEEQSLSLKNRPTIRRGRVGGAGAKTSWTDMSHVKVYPLPSER